MFFLDEELPLGVQDSEEIKKVAVVGTGNIAWHLVRALSHSGIEITYVISRSMNRAEALAEYVSAIPLDDPGKVVDQPDLYLLCVSDDALPMVQATYAGKGSLVVHTSGSNGIDVLDQAGNETGVLYPLQTFSKGVEMTYDHIPFLVEGSDKYTTFRLKHLAERISQQVECIDSQQRRTIHVAAVFACNFNNHLSVIADKLLREAGLDFDLLRPLVEQTLSKLMTITPLEAQTGPALRNDQATIEKHLDALGNNPEEQELYRLLSNNILRYRKKKYE